MYSYIHCSLLITNAQSVFLKSFAVDDCDEVIKPISMSSVEIKGYLSDIIVYRAENNILFKKDKKRE